MMRLLRNSLLATLLLLFLQPQAAHAHLVNSGFGSFYDGMLHLLMTPEDLLLVLALGLLAGQAGRQAARPLLLLLPACWLLCGWLGMLAGGIPELPILTTLSFGCMGLLVVLDRRPPHWLLLGLACLAASLHGYINGAAIRQAGMDGLTITGAAVLVLLLATILPALVVSARQEWMRIGVRVAGSWISAAALLMLGWIWSSNRG